jgi:hypothetical protein
MCARGSLGADLKDGLDLNGCAKWELTDTNCSPSMLASRPEDLDQELRGSVQYEMLLGETGGRLNESCNFQRPEDAREPSELGR